MARFRVPSFQSLGLGPSLLAACAAYPALTDALTGGARGLAMAPTAAAAAETAWRPAARAAAEALADVGAYRGEASGGVDVRSGGSRCEGRGVAGVGAQEPVLLGDVLDLTAQVLKAHLSAGGVQPQQSQQPQHQDDQQQQQQQQQHSHEDQQQQRSQNDQQHQHQQLQQWQDEGPEGGAVGAGAGVSGAVEAAVCRCLCGHYAVAEVEQLGCGPARHLVRCALALLRRQQHTSAGSHAQGQQGRGGPNPGVKLPHLTQGVAAAGENQASAMGPGAAAGAADGDEGVLVGLAREVGREGLAGPSLFSAHALAAQPGSLEALTQHDGAAGQGEAEPRLDSQFATSAPSSSSATSVCVGQC